MPYRLRPIAMHVGVMMPVLTCGPDRFAFFIGTNIVVFSVTLGLAVLAGTAWVIWRALRRDNLLGTVRIEIAGLSAGLVVIATHSFVQYNFYVRCAPGSEAMARSPR